MAIYFIFSSTKLHMKRLQVMMRANEAGSDEGYWASFFKGFLYRGIIKAILENKQWDEDKEEFKHPPMDPRATFYATIVSGLSNKNQAEARFKAVCCSPHYPDL